MVYVPLPTIEDRKSILEACTQASPLDIGVNFEMIASDPRCERFSGADLASLVREAGIFALKRYMQNDGASPIIFQDDFVQALDRIQPSVSSIEQTKYEQMFEKMRSKKQQEESG